MMASRKRPLSVGGYLVPRHSLALMLWSPPREGEEKIEKHRFGGDVVLWP